MKVLVTIQHPAHVHFFKHSIWELEARGHDVRVVAREYDVAIELLEEYGIEHEVLAGHVDTTFDMVKVQLQYEARILNVARKWKPDVITAIGGIAAAHVSKIVDARSVVWTDSPVGSNRITMPFADFVCTPRKFRDDFGDKHVRYDGFHELAYLRPGYFEPDWDALREHGVEPDEPYFLLRFGTMKAHHDIGQKGMPLTVKERLVDLLSEHGEVYIMSVAKKLPDSLSQYALQIPVHLSHSLLDAADMFVTDTHTMATESAILGTPVIRTNSFAGEGDMSNFVEFEERYGLMYSTPDGEDAVEKARSWLERPEGEREIESRRRRLLEETIDVARFVTDAVEAAGEPNATPADIRRVRDSDPVRQPAEQNPA